MLDQLQHTISGIERLATPVPLLDLAQAAGQWMVAEDVSNPPRKVAPSEVGLEVLRRAVTERAAQFAERSDAMLWPPVEDEGVVLRNRDVEILVTVANVWRQARQQPEAVWLCALGDPVRQQDGAPE